MCYHSFLMFPPLLDSPRLNEQQDSTRWLWLWRSRSAYPPYPHMGPGPARSTSFCCPSFHPTISATLYSNTSWFGEPNCGLKALQQLKSSPTLKMAKMLTFLACLRRSNSSRIFSCFVCLVLKTKSKSQPLSHFLLQIEEGRQRGRLRQQSLVVRPKRLRQSIAFRILALEVVLQGSSIGSEHQRSCWAERATRSPCPMETALEAAWASSLAQEQPAHTPSAPEEQSAHLVQELWARRSNWVGTARTANSKQDSRTSCM